jgi:hypothetical protein
MICRARAERPMEPPVRLPDRHVVDAGFASAHQALAIKLPLLVAVGAKPVPRIVMPFVLEANGDAVVGDGPEFLDQAVIELSGPFTPQERNRGKSPGSGDFACDSCRGQGETARVKIGRSGLSE